LVLRLFSTEILRGTKIASIGVGDFLRSQRVFSRDDVQNFAKVSGDCNRIHLDAEYAATTPFKKCIVHGLLTGSMFSELLGNTFPGVIYISQTLNFLAPVYIGEEVEARLEIIEISSKKRVRLRTTVTKIAEN
jgi:acyl dehydratase